MTRAASSPTVIVDNLHVDYRAYASGKAAGSGMTLLRRRKGIRVVHALRGVSFSVREGETVGIIGANGSGKSTLMRAIAGLTPAASGAVYTASPATLLGVNAILIGELSGEKNVALGTLALGLSRQQARATLPGIVEFSGLADVIDLPMNTYSSGMQARLRFAIAMSRKHQILLVDEALAVGDKAFRAKSEERIRKLREDAGSIFLVSHSMGSILDTCTRALWLDAGQIRMDGKPKDVVRAYTASK